MLKELTKNKMQYYYLVELVFAANTLQMVVFSIKIQDNFLLKDFS